MITPDANTALRERFSALMQRFNCAASTDALKPAILALAVCALSQAEQPLSPAKTYHFASAIGALHAGWLKEGMQHLDQTLHDDSDIELTPATRWRTAIEGVTFEHLTQALQYLTRINRN